MPATGVPVPFAAVGVTPGATRGIRKTLADVPGPKDGAMFDHNDKGGVRSVKECPECGGTYTGAVSDHKHVVRVGKSLGIRDTLRIAKAAYNPAPKKMLPKVTLGGPDANGGSAGPRATVRTQAAPFDRMRDMGRKNDPGDLSYTPKVTGRPRPMAKAGEHCDNCADALMKCASCGCHKPQDAHEEETMAGKENVGIRKALAQPAPVAAPLDGIRSFTKSLRSRIANGPNPGNPVGYMVGRNHPGTSTPAIGGGHDVFCSSCSPRVPHRTPLFKENIGDYRQSCHGCGRTLVEGKTPMWPELFDKR
jgi:hypothetical protein